MKAYVGHTSSSRLIALLNGRGIGEATQPGEFPPNRMPYFLDNGAFKDWSNGREFRGALFLENAERAGSEGPTPDFIVAPDRVAAKDSLSLSLSWVPRLRDFGPLALVVQDGMQEEQVADAVRRGGFTVLFVGGTLAWKFATLPAWVAFGRRLGMSIHCGRMGTAPRVRYAMECGVDSIDSCTPLWSTDNMRRFLGALDSSVQQPMFGEPVAPPVRQSAWTKAADRAEDAASRRAKNMDLFGGD